MHLNQVMVGHIPEIKHLLTQMNKLNESNWIEQFEIQNPNFVEEMKSIPFSAFKLIYSGAC